MTIETDIVEQLILDELTRCLKAIPDTSVGMQQDRFNEFSRGVIALAKVQGYEHCEDLEDIVQSALFKMNDIVN